MIIGSSIAPLHNWLYGINLFLVVVSYVGCGFYWLDYFLYTKGEYLDLLWIVDTGAVSDLVGMQFLIQLEYTLYWSIGTASTAAYGDIAAVDPPGVLYNVLCLLFQGFIYSFFISRMHQLPDFASDQDKSLVQLFHLAQQEHTNLAKSYSNKRQLEFDMLCSLEYYETNKQKYLEFFQLLPEPYVLEFKNVVYSHFVSLIHCNFFSGSIGVQKVALLIEQVSTQRGEDPFLYEEINKNDFLYVKEGSVSYFIAGKDRSKHENQLQLKINQGNTFNTFAFVTNLSIPYYSAVCTDYCRIYKLPKQKFRTILTFQEKIAMNQVFHKALNFQVQWILNQPFFTQTNKQKLSKILITTESSNERFYELNPFSFFFPKLQQIKIQKLLTNNTNVRKFHARTKEYLKYKKALPHRIYKHNKQTINIDQFLSQN